ncbi:MAG: putative membrane protein [Paraglaciecola sp.]|jgi:putative membrane protein
MHLKRTWRDYLALSAKGVLMGAADAIPGVSGGTIAFITGIYEELIYSLKQCGPAAIKVLFRQGFGPMWQYVNGTFLFTLLLGILFSILTISRVVLYWLDIYPVMLWSFFFGLILAAIWSLVRHVDEWKGSTIGFFIFGTVAAYFITTISPGQIQPTGLFVFLSGMVAICAMILPGISGSFILLLLGMYTHILTAVKDLEFATLGLFAMGCVVGLLSFSRVLNWMFSSHRALTLALLGGFMLGSLNKVWPWKHTLEFTLNRHGKEMPLVQENILPATFETLSAQPAYLWYSIILMVVGAGIVLLLEKFGSDAQE